MILAEPSSPLHFQANNIPAFSMACAKIQVFSLCSAMQTNEPMREKTNNLGSDQVRHKPDCTVTEDGQRLEILDL